VNLPLSAVFFFAVVAFVLAINRGDEAGWTSPFILSLFALSLLLAVIFVFANRAAANPLVDTTLLCNRPFAWGNLCGFLAKFSDNGPILIIPLYFAVVQGLDPLATGLVMTVRPVFSIIGSGSNAAVSKLARPVTIMILSMALLCGSYLGFFASPAGTAVLVIAILMAVRGLGIGYFYPQNRALIMEAVPAGAEGSGAGFMRQVEQFGIIISIVACQALYSACLPAQFQGDSVNAAQVPAAAALPAFQAVFLTAAVLAGAVMVILWAVRLTGPRYFGTGNSPENR
jgi:hypothetical protein